MQRDLPEGFEKRVRDFIDILPEKMKNDYERIFQDNKIVRIRTEGVGIISKEDAVDLGLSGPAAPGMRRSLGHKEIESILRI